jgi:hypothetical protein
LKKQTWKKEERIIKVVVLDVSYLQEKKKERFIYGEIFSARFFIDRCKRQNSMRI